MKTGSHTNLQCLALVARHHGVDLSPERLVHDYSVGEQPVATRKLIRMAKDAGLRARQARISWQALFQLGDAYPVLAELENGNWVVIASAVVSGEQEVVKVLDPLAERPEVLLVTEQQFTRNWGG